MATQIYESLAKENLLKADRMYRSSLNEHNGTLNIDIYDKKNPPKKYHDKRLTIDCLKKIARETFTGIDFICDVCADSGVQINFKPKSDDDTSQKYSGHTICINENPALTTALTIKLQMGKDPKILPSAQRENYLAFINKVIIEYLSNGQDAKKYAKPTK